ncbi:ABC transporter ATP-binding protein [Glaciecola sp. XM2]|jgi:ATP-binding cassette subfamily F protein uup|uniref:ATP-binding cassette ATPase Uup n=1 Tax=Glaciecola sp. XM2 TaxID=1914931 RepID=UPI001BDE4327|nr:ABC transporter ATP-binding protein [Glaciecola sp. XM2]MBT1449685.1 ABC transporter ATP-binding protein [Glaciecola sp. XM2]
MNLIQLKNASILFGQPPLIDGADLNIQTQERVCILGRNGSGKSTLLKVLSGELKLDDGQRIVAGETVISRLEQDPPAHTDTSIFEYVAQGLGDNATLITEYHAQADLVAQDASEQALLKLQALQEQLDARNAWQLEQRIDNVLTQLSLPANTLLSDLSGGWRRKAALARALVSQPDVLLLDEPTNHLDIDMVKWLEKTLLSFAGTLVFISHDRSFIRNLATRVVDIDRGQVTSYPVSYDKYLEQKAHDLEVEATHQKEFDKKLAKEEVWIRQGIKARRTRNEGRVRALKALREEYKARRKVMGTAVIQSGAGHRSGKRVFELEHVSFGYENLRLIDQLDLLITRGDKLALIGANGCGKSSLIKLLLGDIEPQEGSVHRGVNLEIAYFDQHRSQLELDKPLIDAIADGKREVMVNGAPRHVISYLQDYLFSPERVNAPVSTLSGGEKNRLMLAKLMLKPSNLLILDEPTNDLDVETLELLESLLVEYDGTVLLVSHDREFIDNVVTSSLVFEGDGKITEFVGGYSDAQAWYQQSQQEKPKTKKNIEKATISPLISENKATQKKVNKLSYHQSRELESLPKEIEKLEVALAALQTQVNDAEFFQQGSDITQPVLDKLQACEHDLEVAFERWEELEELKNNV